MQITDESVCRILGFSSSDESDGEAHSAPLELGREGEEYVTIDAHAKLHCPA
jgi:hypothetical protein